MSVSSSSKSNLAEVDSWGSPSNAVLSPRIPTSTSTTVRDDWDDDEDDVAQEEVDPQKLWEEANSRAPMPQVVIAGSSTCHSTALSPPPAALQPVLRILKRPSASTSTTTSMAGSPSPRASATSSPSPSLDASKSYAEREARYQAARERIFGESPDGNKSADGSSSTTTSANNNSDGVSVQIAREPKGPPSRPSGERRTAPGGSQEQTVDERGFSSRRGGRRGGRTA
ncbi:hypothetical protein BD414DRAFT_484758 [Trametes punicea]|nr:hypothetical protein BD414DRAFT_484758 [Trametes punicea]